MALWWLSFAPKTGPATVVIVEADALLSAVSETNRRQINPHGEVLGFEIPREMEAIWRPHMNKPLSINELQRIEPGVMTIAELEDGGEV